MAYIHERRERLLGTADELQKELFEKRIRMLEAEYGKEESRRAVIQVFEKAAVRWMTAHADPGHMERAASLRVTYLFSSILMRSYEFKLSLLGEEFWLEEEPVTVAWKPPFFFEYFEEDMKLIVKELRSSFPRLCRAEEDAVRLKCADYYLAAACKLCKDLAEEIMGSNEFIKVDKTDDFFVFFGKFQGEGEKLWNISC